MEENRLQEKARNLAEVLKRLGKVVVAFSGGVDSSLLAFKARKVLGKENVLAVTADSETFPGDEFDFAKEFTTKYDISHDVFFSPELEEINKQGNPVDRCYHCKKGLFSIITEIAKKYKGYVVEGSNLDDNQDYRPGHRAIEELQVFSPLREAGLTKADIRALSKEAGLSNWDKPAYACLTSRFPYHIEIKAEDLKKVEKAEKYLRGEGFIQCRVRHYGEKARVEVDRKKVSRALAMEEQIKKTLTGIGYKEVVIDPDGYRMGSMNVFTK